MNNESRFIDYFYKARAKSDEYEAKELEGMPWKIYGSSLAVHVNLFNQLFKEYSRNSDNRLLLWMQDRKKHGQSVFVLDVAGQASFREELIDGQRGVTLVDKRTQSEKIDDIKINSDLIEGSILYGKTFKKIGREIEKMTGNPDTGYDLILMDPLAGWDGIAPLRDSNDSMLSEEYAARMRYRVIMELYRVLSPNNGVMLVNMNGSSTMEDVVDLLQQRRPNEASITFSGSCIRIDKLKQQSLKRKSHASNVVSKFNKVIFNLTK